jgi:hypothetical protein
MAAQPTRRELVAAGLAGTAASWGVAPAAQAADAMPPPSDAQLMAGLVAVEREVLFVYERALGSGELKARWLRTVQEIAAHERAHIAALLRVLPALGASAPPGPAGVSAANAALAKHHMDVDLRRHRHEKDWVKLLGDVEDVLERNYHLAISLLRAPALIRLCAEIMASEGQHSALLATLRERDVRKALPDAFVNGSR